MIPGNYIVRIYRRGEDDPRMVVGVVEEVGVREKKWFHSIEELRLILDLPPSQPIRRPREGGNGGNGGGGKTDKATPASAGGKGSSSKRDRAG